MHRRASFIKFKMPFCSFHQFHPRACVTWLCTSTSSLAAPKPRMAVSAKTLISRTSAAAAFATRRLRFAHKPRNFFIYSNSCFPQVRQASFQISERKCCMCCKEVNRVVIPFASVLHLSTAHGGRCQCIWCCCFPCLDVEQCCCPKASLAIKESQLCFPWTVLLPMGQEKVAIEAFQVNLDKELARM